MIDIPFSVNFIQNMDRTNSHGDFPCIICGCKAANARYWVHVHGGFSTIVTDEEAAALNKGDERGADMGMFPIGSDCLRKHPEIKSYVQDSKQTTERKPETTFTYNLEGDGYIYPPNLHPNHPYPNGYFFRLEDGEIFASFQFSLDANKEAYVAIPAYGKVHTT